MCVCVCVCVLRDETHLYSCCPNLPACDVNVILFTQINWCFAIYVRLPESLAFPIWPQPAVRLSPSALAIGDVRLRAIIPRLRISPVPPPLVFGLLEYGPLPVYDLSLYFVGLDCLPLFASGFDPTFSRRDLQRFPIGCLIRSPPILFFHMSCQSHNS